MPPQKSLQSSSPSKLTSYYSSPSSSRSLVRRSPYNLIARPRREPSPVMLTPLQEQEAQQEEDLRAEDLKPSEIRQLHKDLDFWNTVGRMVSYDRDLKDWVTWYR